MTKQEVKELIIETVGVLNSTDFINANFYIQDELGYTGGMPPTKLVDNYNIGGINFLVVDWELPHIFIITPDLEQSYINWLDYNVGLYEGNKILDETLCYIFDDTKYKDVIEVLEELTHSYVDPKDLHNYPDNWLD